MQIIDLYRYEENGTVIITPNRRNETDTPSRMRLIAEENCILTDGTTEATVIDVMLDEVDRWREIAEMSEASDLKAQAYDILMGVTE